MCPVCRDGLLRFLCSPQFVLRHCNFLALMRPGNAYSELLSGADFAMMPWLRKFQVGLQDHAVTVGGLLLCRCGDSSVNEDKFCRKHDQACHNLLCGR